MSGYNGRWIDLSLGQHQKGGKIMAKQLVRLWERPSYDGRRFRYYLLYTDEQGRRRQKSLGHADHSSGKLCVLSHISNGCKLVVGIFRDLLQIRPV